MIDVKQEQFVIDTPQKAEWALIKIKEMQEDYERLDTVCQQQIDFYKKKQLKYKMEYEKNKGGLLMMLERYFQTVPSKITKTQATHELPSGKLVKKFAKQELKHDPDKLIELLKDTDYVTLKPTLKWGEYKKTLQIVGDKAIDENGEIIDGITVTTKPESFDVEVD